MPIYLNSDVALELSQTSGQHHQRTWDNLSLNLLGDRIIRWVKYVWDMLDICRLNNKGLSTQPCFKPTVEAKGMEIPSWSFTEYCPFLNMFWMVLRKLPQMCNWDNLWNSAWRNMLSKAALKSTRQKINIPARAIYIFIRHNFESKNVIQCLGFFPVAYLLSWD